MFRHPFRVTGLRGGPQQGTAGPVVSVLLMSMTAFVLSTPSAWSTGRPSGTKAAPYLPTTVAGATTTSLVVAPGRVVIDGKGFGHGVGLAQDGAYWMGKAGKNVSQILSLFFPGTSLAKRNGVVRVPLASLGSLSMVLPSGGSAGGVAVPPGGSVRAVAGSGVVSINLAGAPVDGPAPTVAMRDLGQGQRIEFEPRQKTGFEDVGEAVRLDDRFSRFEPVPAEPVVVPTATEPSTVPPATPTRPSGPSGPSTGGSTVQSTAVLPGVSEDQDPVDTIQTRPGAVSATAPMLRVTSAKGGVIAIGAKRYRGTIEFVAKPQGMRVVNEIDIEQYLRGMGEVTDPRWPAAALQAQAVVARTYALRMMTTRGEVCPTQACQVYVGAQAEYPEMDAAVTATAGKVVVYKGELANTFYSASGGGTIADPSEVFGEGTPIPYLKAGTYPTGDPKAWRVEFSLVELGRRVGYPGVLYDVVVSKVGPSGRAVEVTFVGSTGARSVAGPVFDRILGLRSTNFRLVVGRSDPLASTLPITGSVLALDVGVVERSALDFQNGLFDENETDLVTTLASSSTVFAAAATTAGVPSTTPPPARSVSVSVSVPTAANSATDAPDLVESPPAGGSDPEIAEAAGAGESGSAATQDRGRFGGIAAGIVGLLGIGWVLKWGMKPERPATEVPKK